jgi:hypothetical protein
MIMKRFKRLMVGFTLGTLALPVLAGVPRVPQPLQIRAPINPPVLGTTHSVFTGSWGALNPQPLPPKVWTSPAALQWAVPAPMQQSASR